MKWLKHISTQIQAIPQWNWLCLGLSCIVFSPLLGAISIAGVAFQFYWQHRHQPTFVHPVRWVFGLLSGWLILSACLSPQSGDALLGLAHFLPYFWVFGVFQSLLNTPQRLRVVAWLLVFTALPVTIIGLGQLFGGWSGPIRMGALLNWGLHPTGNPPGRMSSVFDYANVLANYLVIIWPLAIGLAGDTFQQCQNQTTSMAYLLTLPKSWRWIRSAKAEFSLLSLILVLLAAALILTNSRNAWAIALLTVLAYALYWGWHGLVAGVSLMAASIAGAAFAPAPIDAPLRTIVPAFFWARLNDQLYPNRPVAELRNTQWDFAWFMAMQRPWTGWGLRSFPSLYEAKTGLALGHPHNLYLMLAAETGFVAALLLVGLVGWMVWQSIRTLVQQPWRSQHQLLGFMYLSAFLATSLFHGLDIPLFDLRINVLGWLLLAGLNGVIDTSDRRDVMTQ